jgi:hypothetical protein
VMVEFPDRGCLCVGWDVITLVERPDQASTSIQASTRFRSQ